MEAVVELPAWQEVLSKNPNNRDVMERWMMAYYPCDNTKLVPGLDDDIACLNMAVLVPRSGSTDINHPRATSERLAANLPGARLVEPPWGDNEWNDRSADQAAPRFAGWPLLVPQLIEWSNELITSSCNPASNGSRSATSGDRSRLAPVWSPRRRSGHRDRCYRRGR